ncbi:MAG: efflux RND transporter periplasmic adaptor subunit [Cytophagales bacterium]
MKNINKTTLIVAASTMAIGLLIGWLIFGGANENQRVENKNRANADTETIWTCSMHPQIRKNEPGDCPICGMDLIPLESTDSDLDPKAVSMSSAAIQLAQVQTMVVDKAKVDKSIRINGKVQPDERLLFTQSSHIPGRIEKLLVNFTGEYVSEGQVLANVYSPDLVTAQVELFEAKKIIESQPALFNAAKEKLKKWKLSDKQIDQIVTSNKTIEQFPILANVSGYVTKKMVNLGDYIKQGEALYEIADLSKVWVLFDVYESDMLWVNKGDAVIYTLQSMPGKTFNGKILYIDPVIDPKTRVAKARLEAINKSLLLKPEMFVSGTIEAKTHADNISLTVPKSAVMWTGKRSVVYVMQISAKGVSFIMREVTLGPDLGESYVIESGLQPGEEIAVNGTFSIDAAAQLAGKPSMMNPEGGVTITGHNHGGNASSSMESMAVSSKKTKITEDAKKSLQPLFENYFKLKVALASDDFEKAKATGAALYSSLGKVDMNLFMADAHSHWMQQSTALNADLQHIQHLSDINAIREKFISISNSMIVIAESFDPISSTIYIQHCPMADSNKGADWLSQDLEIRNPYYGESMLNCGEIRKTIN